MVEHLRSTERVGAVVTPNRLRAVKRDRHRQGRREHTSDEKKNEQAPDSPEAPETSAESQSADNASSTGQRINVVI